MPPAELEVGRDMDTGPEEWVSDTSAGGVAPALWVSNADIEWLLPGGELLVSSGRGAESLVRET